MGQFSVACLPLVIINTDRCITLRAFWNRFYSSGAKRKRGGVKKKRKRLRGDTLQVDTGLGMLLKPLDIKTCSTWKDLAREIIYRLNEVS